MKSECGASLDNLNEVNKERYTGSSESPTVVKFDSLPLYETSVKGSTLKCDEGPVRSSWLTSRRTTPGSPDLCQYNSESDSTGASTEEDKVCSGFRLRGKHGG